MYTVTAATRQDDRLRLYPSPDAARAALRKEDGPIFALAVQLDRSSRRLVPSAWAMKMVDPTWSTPVQMHADGSATARCPIPEVLFLEGPHTWVFPAYRPDETTSAPAP